MSTDLQFRWFSFLAGRDENHRQNGHTYEEVFSVVLQHFRLTRLTTDNEEMKFLNQIPIWKQTV